MTLLVEHSLDRGKSFTTRTVAQLIPKGDGKIGLMFEDRNTVSGEEVQGLRSLISSNDLYTIRITNPDSKAFVMASVPAVSHQQSLKVFVRDLVVSVTCSDLASKRTSRCFWAKGAC